MDAKPWCLSDALARCCEFHRSFGTNKLAILEAFTHTFVAVLRSPGLLSKLKAAPHFCSHETGCPPSRPLAHSPPLQKAHFGRSNKKNHYSKRERPGEHPAWRQINEIHLTFKPQNAKMPESTKKQHFSVPYQTPLILCDISWQFPALCKCLPAIWFKQMSWVKQPDRQFLGGCFLFSLSCLTERPSNGQISPGDRGVTPPPLLLSLPFSHFLFFLKQKGAGCCWCSCWILNPVHVNITFCLHDVAPNSNKNPAHCTPFVSKLFPLQRRHCKSSKPRLRAACGLLSSGATCLLVWLLGHIILAGPRSEAEGKGAGAGTERIWSPAQERGARCPATCQTGLCGSLDGAFCE